MSHKPIILSNLAFTLPHKTCFAHANLTISPGSKIGIIGPNGNGKTTLLKIIQGLAQPSSGKVITPDYLTFGYVPQQSNVVDGVSGAQHFNNALTQALALQPDVLCLDEPTNHLDHKNRSSLMRLLQHFDGTLLIISHDVQLLQTCVTSLWLVEHEAITVFNGSYNDFVREHEAKANQTKAKIKALEKQYDHAHAEQRQQQERSARRARANKGENDRTVIGFLKNNADSSAGKATGKLSGLKSTLSNARQQLQEPETIQVSFELAASKLPANKYSISVTSGSVGYTATPIIENISLNVRANERIAILGVNGSGKSTLIKALLHNPAVTTTGSWHIPAPSVIGYLDQHYATLDASKTVLETVKAISTLADAQLRRLLNDFLFRKNEEVNTLVQALSGGEKARLALACIALQQPPILILDEVTNNLDIQTRQHVIEVIRQFPGALVVISHDDDFLQAIYIETYYEINGTKLQLLQR
jgi:ATPase subunit of ABC transporter with duplicated ATPase domains